MTAVDTIACTDAVEGLRSLDDESVQLTVTSPPYNIGKDYGADDDDRAIGEWCELVEDVVTEAFRVTKPDGKLVVNVGWAFADREAEGRFYHYPLGAYITLAAVEAGWDLWDQVIWSKRAYHNAGGGALMGSYPYPTNFMVAQTHEYVLIFRKWVSASYHRTRELPPKGTPEREESALTKERWQELTQSIWEFDGVNQSAQDVDHGAVFPEELPKRAIQLYSFVGDVVLDPFMGTGTTAVAAKRAGRHYIGFDLNPEYVEYARERVDAAEFADPDYITPREVDT